MIAGRLVAGGVISLSVMPVPVSGGGIVIVMKKSRLHIRTIYLVNLQRRKVLLLLISVRRLSYFSFPV